MATQLPYDYSTVNIPLLMRQPVVELAPHEHFQQMPGVDCFLHPPGFPTYYLVQVLDYSDQLVGDEVYMYDMLGKPRLMGKQTSNLVEDMRPFWRPLPMEHVRFKFWERKCYLELWGCVFDLNRNELFKGVDFRQDSNALPWHAASLHIEGYYPLYYQHKDWVYYQPDRDPTNLQQGFEWRGQWVNCCDDRGKPIEYGWERMRLREFEQAPKRTR